MSGRDILTVAAIRGRQRYVILYEDGHEPEVLKTILRWAWCKDVNLPPELATAMAAKVRLQEKKPEKPPRY